jgi:hypothetical protein
VMAQRRAIPWPLYLMLLMIFNCEHAFIVWGKKIPEKWRNAMSPMRAFVIVLQFRYVNERKTS